MSDRSTSKPPETEPRPRSRKRFERKRDAILDAATILINTEGAKGATLQAVARAVDLNTTSVTYYFSRKDQLAAAVFERTMDRLAEMVAEAAAMPDPQARVRRLVELHVELRAATIRDEALPLASLADMRTLDDPIRLPLEKRFQGIFRDIRGFFGNGRSGALKDVDTARTQILLETLFWMPVWIARYPTDEFAGVTDRLFDILAYGLAPEGAVWDPVILSDGEAPEGGVNGERGAGDFLRVATRLINESGYRSASVMRIVEELKVSKGSFYHHLEAKDDLVLECFRCSYRRVSAIQAAARAQGLGPWRRISSVIASVLDIQFEASSPLTRTSALQALPPDLRQEVLEGSDRIALRCATNLIDGAQEGSLRIVDPMIASQTCIATLNSAFELRKWASRMPRDRAIAIYASALTRGMFDDGVGSPL